MRTREELQEFVADRLKERLFVVASNREPYIHSLVDGKLKCSMPAGGLTSALDPMMRACGGTWVAHGSGEGDWEVVDKRGRTQVPPENPRYILRRVKLTGEQEQGYYYGFSNEALWPLCHMAYEKPVFNETDWQTYADVNRIFADCILDEVSGRRALVFIQDYHLALVSQILKRQNPDMVVAQFWHIPWPSREVMRICPWRDEILDGLLGNDLLGFHIPYYCESFIETTRDAMGTGVSYSNRAILRGSRSTCVMPFPISVDFEEISRSSENDEVLLEIKRLKEAYSLVSEYILVGLDRIDYTKGIPERFRAMDRFLQNFPQYRGRVTLVQVGAPSRTTIGAYQRLNHEINDLALEINDRYGTGHWQPVVNVGEFCPPITLSALRRMADVAVVTPLNDGMNLVAKEFVASRNDEDGVLILSQFTGAADEMADALLVNPYAPDQLAEAYKQALEMPVQERRARMKRMRNVVREHNIYHWAADIVAEMLSLETGGH